MKRKAEKREMTEDERSVMVAVRHCARELSDFLQGARLKAQRDSKSFASNGITTFFRAVSSYADMYEKLGLKSRTELYKIFARSRDCMELQDTQDALEDVEGLMKNFIINLDSELLTSFEDKIKRKKLEEFPNITGKIHLGQEFNTKTIFLYDLSKNRECNLFEYLLPNFVSYYILFCPCYLPDTQVRFRMDQIKKVKEDFDEFKVAFIVVTWGPKDDAKDWSRNLRRVCNWPILYDQHFRTPLLFNFKKGLTRLWSPEGLEFCGINKTVREWPVNPPSLEIDFLEWPFIGGEIVLSREKIDYFKVKNTRVQVLKEFESVTGADRMRKRMKKLNKDSSSENDEEDPDLKIGITCPGPELPLAEAHLRLSLYHRCSNMSDMANSGAIYQSILSCYAKFKNTSEWQVIDRIREARKFRIAPDKHRLERQEGHELLYDPQTELYFDNKSGYYWDARTRSYFYWDKNAQHYEKADQIIRAEMVKKQMEEIAKAQSAAFKAQQERDNAMKAAAQVVAQLAAIRANKDDYAAYTYRTCIEPQSKEIFEGLSKNDMPNQMLANASQTGLRVQQNIDKMVQEQKNIVNSSVSNPALTQIYDDELPPGVEPDF